MVTRTARKSTAPRKAAPAKVSASAPAPASNGAAFDFASLTIGDAPVLPSSGKRGLDPANTPFPAAVEASWAAAEVKTVTIKGEKQERKYGAVRTVTVPESMVDKTVRIIRRSADHLDGVGVRVVPGKAVDGKVTIAFRAQTRRAGSED